MKYWSRGAACLVALLVLTGWTVFGHAGEIVIGYTGPLSGPAAEYGMDCLNGADLAVKDINAAGGITVKGQKYLFKLEKLDDKTDPTQATNNARRFRANKAIAVFNGVFTTLAPILKINEEKGNEFLVMAYTSTPKITQMGNKLLVATTLPFTVYCQSLSDMAWAQGWRKAAMLTTMGAYGDEWRHSFKKYWEKLGGTVTIDKPANYYKETDFSTQLTAVLATKPDVMLVGGPSATTALVIEQARGMGFKGGMILIDQAKLDYVAEILRGLKLMENCLGVAALPSNGYPAFAAFDKRYTALYKRMNTSEAVRNYTAVYALAKAIEIAGTPTDVHAIRAAFPKVFPLLGDKFPVEEFGITPQGRIKIIGTAQMIKNGKWGQPVAEFWWPKSQKEYNEVKKLTKSGKGVTMEWFKAKIDDVQ